MSVSIPLFSQDIYQHLPQQRRLDDEDKQEVRELLNLKVNKKHLQNISESKGKVVTLRDISNVRIENQVLEMKGTVWKQL